MAQRNDIVIFRTPEIELAFSREDGGLRALQRVGGPNAIGHGDGRPSIDVRLGDGPWLADHAFVRYLGHTERVADDGASELEIVIGIGPLKVFDRLRITGTLVSRTISLRNVGEDPVRLRGVRLALPWVRLGVLDSCRFESPGASVRPRVALSIAGEQRLGVLPRRFFAPGLRDNRAIELAPLFTPGLLAVHNLENDESLLCWYLGAPEPSLPQVEGNDVAVTLQHEIGLAGQLGSERSLSAGVQYILLVHDPWPAALAAFRRTWTLAAGRHTAVPAGWVSDAAIYETHPALAGGFAGLSELLPELEALGIDTLVLMPIWPYGSGRARLWDGNWQSSGDPYALRELELLDPALGPPEDLRSLVDAAHAREMRVLVDLPLLGCAPDSRYLYEHPHWFCRDDNGRLTAVPGRPGIVAFDWSSGSLRDHMAGRIADLVRDYGLDGVRAITPRQMVTNWGGTNLGHTSAGQSGHLTLLEVLRHILATVRPDLVVIGDLAGPIGAYLQDASVDELAHHMLVHTAMGRLNPSELAEWLDDHFGALPAGGPRICFTESHRTRLINPLADGLRGSRISRMLLAGIVLCGFVPSIWAGQERDERDTIARLLIVRRERAALRAGDTRYNAVPCNNAHVFTVLRMNAGEHVVGLLHISPHRQTVTLCLPVDTLGLSDGEYRLHELLADRCWSEEGRISWRRDELLALSLTVEPFGAYCLVVEPA